MKRVLSRQLPVPGRSIELPEDESKHLIQVLRLRDGSRIEVLDGQGSSVIGTLRIEGKRVHVDAESAPARTEAQTLPIVLEVAILKGEAMEWIVEKAVELGAESLVPLVTDHTVVQIDRKGPKAFQERWQRIADQALKQCGRLQKLKVETPVSLEEFLAKPASGQRLWFDEAGRDASPFLADWLVGQETDSTATPQPLRILVGPEGGWSQKERDLLSRSAQSLSLGPMVLRAETAALFGLSLTAGHLRSRRPKP